MTLLALLTKELRLRFRSERSIWVLVVYVLLLALLCMLILLNNSRSNFGTIGTSIYYILIVIQLLLAVFVTPAYTATAIYGEKERQTFDLLMSSRLSGFSLIGGKLIAGIVNSLLFVVVAIPLSSLIFFFGGVTPLQFLTVLLVYCSTALIVGMMGLFFSTIFARSAVSTAVTYMVSLLWLLLPAILLYTYSIMPHTSNSNPNDNSAYQLFVNVSLSLSPASAFDIYGQGIGSIGPIPDWLIYILLNISVALALFLVSASIVRPKSFWRSSAIKATVAKTSIVGS